MIRGDFSYSANGTVTYVDGDKVYAFGHPNLGAGSTDLPMSQGYVITLLPNMQNSFKLAVPLDVVGAFKQDRNYGNCRPYRRHLENDSGQRYLEIEHRTRRTNTISKSPTIVF